MVTIMNINRFNNTIEIYGLSTDNKPTDIFRFKNVNYTIVNGSTFYEMDTKSAFLFDEENKQWVVQ